MHSGANYDRPGFQEMFEMMEQGQISTLITKDLSRLGRNYIETGMYIETIFLRLGVRYIAIADGVDTAYNMGDDIMPFKNLFNEYHVKGTSKKVRMAFQAMARRGERLATAKKYTHITELTPEILNTMIDKIIIGERESKHSKKAVKQKIRILFKGFGELDDLMCV